MQRLNVLRNSRPKRRRKTSIKSTVKSPRKRSTSEFPDPDLDLLKAEST